MSSQGEDETYPQRFIIHKQEEDETYISRDDAEEETVAAADGHKAHPTQAHTFLGGFPNTFALSPPAPNMATITASLERSMQNCSLNRDGSGADGGVGLSATSDEPDTLTNSNTAVELNSHVALPYHWEQCLDLKTGELYYLDWENGTKAKEDPRMKTSRAFVGGGGVDFYNEEDSSFGYGGGDYGYGYDSDGEGSSSTSTTSPSPLRDDHRYDQGDHVLVVAGCKRCFMYFMLPKQVAECPKCNGLILHFDRSENGSP